MGKISASGSFDSAPSSFVSRDKSVRRSAQDDGFVWELSGAFTDIVHGFEGVRAAPAGGGLALVTFSCFHRLGYLQLVAQDDGFVWELSGALTDIVGGLRGLERRQQEEDLHW